MKFPEIRKLETIGIIEVSHILYKAEEYEIVHNNFIQIVDRFSFHKRQT